jgi:hypothetical protein
MLTITIDVSIGDGSHGEQVRGHVEASASTPKASLAAQQTSRCDPPPCLAGGQDRRIWLGESLLSVHSSLAKRINPLLLSLKLRSAPLHELLGGCGCGLEHKSVEQVPQMFAEKEHEIKCFCLGKQITPYNDAVFSYVLFLCEIRSFMTETETETETEERSGVSSHRI